MRFTAESQEVLLTWFTSAQSHEDDFEVVARLLTDLEQDRWDCYRHEQLQDQRDADRYLFYLATRRLIAVVDRWPTAEGEILLDLVNVFQDDDIAHSDPWGLP